MQICCDSLQAYDMFSGVVGIVITACSLPIPGYFAKRVKGLQTERMKRVCLALSLLLALSFTKMALEDGCAGPDCYRK